MSNETGRRCGPCKVRGIDRAADGGRVKLANGTRPRVCVDCKRGTDADERETVARDVWRSLTAHEYETMRDRAARRVARARSVSVADEHVIIDEAERVDPAAQTDRILDQYVRSLTDAALRVGSVDAIDHEERAALLRKACARPLRESRAERRKRAGLTDDDRAVGSVPVDRLRVSQATMTAPTRAFLPAALAQLDERDRETLMRYAARDASYARPNGRQANALRRAAARYLDARETVATWDDDMVDYRMRERDALADMVGTLVAGMVDDVDRCACVKRCSCGAGLVRDADRAARDATIIG